MNYPTILVMFGLALFTQLLGCDTTPNDASPKNRVVQPRSDGIANEQQEKSTNDADSSEDSNRKPVIQTTHSQALTHAPADLHAILDQFKPVIDYRYASNDSYPHEGCFWRMELNDNLMKAHISRFHLEPTAKSRLTDKMLLNFPADWPDISNTKLQWYAWPHNRDDGNNLQLWFVMAIDPDTSVLYFFYQNYDVTP